MASSPTRHVLDHTCGRVLARTSRGGLAATVGHDLLLEITRWKAEVLLTPRQATGSVRAELEVDSLTVVQGSGGALPLTDRDRREIARNARRSLSADRHPLITFAADGAPIGRLRRAGADEVIPVEGTLTVAGRAAPVLLDAVHEGGSHYRLTGSVTQTDHGITPYSAFFGTLRLRDAVAVEIELTLPD
jgi:hypothetical protein